MSGNSHSDCIFCRIAAGEAPCFKVLETDQALAFMDIQPAARGHTLVIPKAHHRDVFDTPEASMRAVTDAVRRVAAALRDVVEPEGITITQANGPTAGQSVMHYHTHLIPRWEGVRLRMHGTEAGDPEALRALAAAIADRIEGAAAGRGSGASGAASTYKLVLIRHGESTWNRENRFTGWTDVDLTDTGVAQARAAAAQLEADGFGFDVAYTSVLKRAIRTLWIVLDEMDLMWIPVHRDWRLNERHYGALQGLNKAETAAKHGDDQVLVWRRSYDTRPPALAPDHPDHPARDPRYRGLDPADLPAAECLKDTVARFLPYWHAEIAPAVRSGKRVLIAAHGNSLRALVKYLDDVSESEIVGLNIPTGAPLVYELDASLKPIRSYYLGDPDEIARAMQAVANQGKAQAGG